MKAPPKEKSGAGELAELEWSTPRARATAEAWSKERHLYKPLPRRFRRDGFDYLQIAREGDVAVYEQTWKCKQNSAVFEVIRIRRRDGFEIGGRFVQPAEVYPNAEAWGTDGFTVTDKDTAFAKLRELA